MNQKGQSSIEFILSMGFVFAMFFLFVNQAFNFTIGYLGHYATFMASRAFMAHDNGSMNNYGSIMNDAQVMGRRVFNRYQLPVFIGESAGEVQFNRPDQGVFYEFTGAYFRFQRPFSTYKFFGGDVKIDLLTESFLGKEPTRYECRQQLCQAVSGGECGANSEVLKHSTLYDNGC